MFLVSIAGVSICRIFAKVCESTLEKCESANLPWNIKQENNKLKLFLKCIFLPWYFGHVGVTNSNQQGGRQQGSDINKGVKILYL